MRKLRNIRRSLLRTTLHGAANAIDPIFSGLAWSLIFGLFASTIFTLFVIPVCYGLIYSGRSNNRKLERV